MKDDELYNRIDADDEMSDSEKRESYSSEIENQEDEQRWQDDQR